MFSVMNTGTKVLPLCTAMVSPTMSGMTIEAGPGLDDRLFLNLGFFHFIHKLMEKRKIFD